MLNWSKLELEFVIKNSPFINDEEGARQFSMIFNRTITRNTWMRLRVRLGIKKNPGSGATSIIPGSPLDRAGISASDLMHVNIQGDILCL